MTSRRTTWLRIFLKLALSFLAIGYVASAVDLSAAWQRATASSSPLVIAAAGVTMLQIVIGGLRWHVILGRLDVRVRAQDSLRLFYIAAFFNACLWGAFSGDIVRAWLSTRDHGKGFLIVCSVVLDRVAAVTGVAILSLVTAPWLIARLGFGINTAAPLGVAVATLGCVGVMSRLDRLPMSLRRLTLARLLHGLGKATAAVFGDLGSAIPALGLAALAQTVMAISAYLLAASLALDVTPLDCLVLMQPVALIAALPISIGGWGVREAAMVGFFGLVGVPADAALAWSVQIGVLTIAASLPGGALWLLWRPRSGDGKS